LNSLMIRLESAVCYLTPTVRDYNFRFSSFDMRRSLNDLFNLMNDSGELFDTDDFDLSRYTQKESTYRYTQEDIDLIHVYFKRGFDISIFNKTARNLFELSADVFDTFIHAWMSEFPIEKEMLEFVKKIFAQTQNYATLEEKRRATQNCVSDRSDENTLTVLIAAEKVQYEIHRMMGLLRFSPNERGEYIAYCAPDHFILPALGEYFFARFGKTSWAIVDEKRKLRLYRLQGECVKLVMQEVNNGNDSTSDEWEDLWRHYHKTINNESRKNTGLQRQLMPKRYWKYLPEMDINDENTPIIKRNEDKNDENVT
jgi:probable DNA metabolism protein